MNKILCAILLLCLTSAQSYAAEVKLKMPNGLVANAAYTSGTSDKPLIFLLHGFLQTHHFSTISRLFESLSGEGYSVFSPTMSLGIPDRKKSLACEALHDHTMEDDKNEIDAWMKWLKDKGHNNIILMGHSQGSTSLLNYLTEHRSNLISKFIAVSILEVNVSRNDSENKRFNKLLESKISETPRVPLTSKLSYCVKYFGTPRSFQSFQSWTTGKILKEIQEIKLPVRIIMGGSDNRIRKNWIEKLKDTRKPVTVIDGANHFMDGFNEFDLLEVVLKELLK
ncbi:MAG: alpha/beta hydrolase [Gammaproteobacteria bacterium]|nr:alpha/beta hydrolase [Gammaproteobacteria bacterium]MCW8986842.1 alpha/beta hydrolase [Gammaproteobacteria bacterium]MCW9030096.1 alpha/beta hydrolase [Gammaproteobacteria bacterium]